MLKSSSEVFFIKKYILQLVLFVFLVLFLHVGVQGVVVHQ